MKNFINIILFPLFLIYQLIVGIRNCLYDRNIFKSAKLPCKIISVGNITVGGTGKTPTVIAIAKFLRQQNKTVAVLSRGYGRKSSGTRLVTVDKTNKANWKNFGDEPTLMAKHLSDIPVVVDEKRTRGAEFLISQFNPEIIILDDGFQHRKLFRDVDIVLVNSNISKFSKRIFGFGNFRESWQSLRRAHLIFLTKSDYVSPSLKLRKKLTTFNLPIFISNIAPASYLLDHNYNKIDGKHFNRKTAILFSGIGDPDSFNKTVQNFNIKIIDFIKFQDHRKYSKSDVDRIRNKFNKTGADILLTTEKDFLKINSVDLPIYALPISMNIEKEGYQHLLKLMN